MNGRQRRLARFAADLRSHEDLPSGAPAALGRLVRARMAARVGRAPLRHATRRVALCERTVRGAEAPARLCQATQNAGAAARSAAALTAAWCGVCAARRGVRARVRTVCGRCGAANGPAGARNASGRCKCTHRAVTNQQTPSSAQCYWTWGVSRSVVALAGARSIARPACRTAAAVARPPTAAPAWRRHHTREVTHVDDMTWLTLQAAPVAACAAAIRAVCRAERACGALRRRSAGCLLWCD